MISWKPILLAFAVIALLTALAVGPVLVLVDRQLGHGGPAPEDYYREMTTMGRYGGVRCDGSSAGSGAGRLGRIYPGAGGDMVISGAGAAFLTFDFDSPRTGDEHDLLVLGGLMPDQLKWSRHGPHLLICSRAEGVEMIVARQYCHGDSPEGPWNNQFEELVFPSARQIWLADDLYDEYRADGDLVAVSRADDITELKDIFLDAPEKWTVRSFGDALPRDWFAAYACRHDLD